MDRRSNWDDIPDDFVLPEGNAKRGYKLFKKHCQQCHSLRPDNKQTGGYASIGPTLFNVYCRTSGIENVGGLNLMTANLQNAGVVWNDANLMRYMKNPENFVSGNIAMNFSGLSNFQDRVDIVHFLRDLTYEGKYGQEILKECKNKK